jgi:hypothetical protein
VEFEIPDGRITGKASYRVEPVDATRCRLISQMNFEASGLARLATPLLRLLLKRDAASNHSTLKDLLETRSTTTGS